MTTTEIISACAALPELPIVQAPNMLRAGGYKPSKSERAAITARADFFESLNMSRDVNIRVTDCYSGADIGYLTFSL